jgi:hypothetical protein
VHGDKWAAVAANAAMGAGVEATGLGAYLPGERDELIWIGLALILAALPAIVRTYQRRVGARSTNEGYSLALEHIEQGLLEAPNTQHPTDTEQSTADSALSRG